MSSSISPESALNSALKPTLAAQPLTDAQLLEQIASGQEQALTALYRSLSKDVYGYLLYLVDAPAAAEDLLQEVFLAVWQNAATFEGRSQVKTWVFQIAHYKGLRWLKKEKRQAAVELESQRVRILTSSELAGFDERAHASWRRDQLKQAMTELSKPHRLVLELVFVYGFAYKEIAEIMDCPLGTIKSRVSYARRQLASLLIQREANE